MVRVIIDKMSARRIMLKLSGEALLGNRPFGIDPEFTGHVAEDIARAKKESKAEIGITVGGGNFFRGISAEDHGLDRVVGDHVGMLATMMNALVLQNSLQKIGIRTHVRSAIRMDELADPYIRRDAIMNLADGDIVIFASGTGNPYFTTDMAAVLRALEIGAEVVIKGTDVDGVYNKDPRKHANSKKMKNISFADALSSPDITIMDNSALALCADHNLPVKIFNLTKKHAISRAIIGNTIGTTIS